MKQSTKVYNSDYSMLLKIEVYYSLGGMNYFSGNNEERGYWLSVCPVTRTEHKMDGKTYFSESYVGFSGTKLHVLTTTRQSEKAFKKAQELAKEREQELINVVVRKNNLTKKEPTETTEPTQV